MRTNDIPIYQGKSLYFFPDSIKLKNQWVSSPGHLAEIPPRGKFATFAQVSNAVAIGFLWVIGFNFDVLQGQGRSPGFHWV